MENDYKIVREGARGFVAGGGCQMREDLNTIIRATTLCGEEGGLIVIIEKLERENQRDTEEKSSPADSCSQV